MFERMQKQEKLEMLKRQAKLMGIETSDKSNKIMVKITQLEQKSETLQTQIKSREHEILKLNCEALQLENMKNPSRLPKPQTATLDKIRTQLSELDKVLEERKKVNFTKENSKSLIKLGYNVCNSQRLEMKEAKVDELFRKRKLLFEMEKECQALNKSIMAKSRGSKEFTRSQKFNKTVGKEPKEEFIDCRTEIDLLNKAKLVLAFEDYVSTVRHRKSKAVDSLEEIDQFDSLKSLHSKLYDPSDLLPSHSKHLEADDLTTNVSHLEENFIFVFSMKNYKCLNKHESPNKKRGKRPVKRQSVYALIKDSKPKVPSRRESQLSVKEKAKGNSTQCCTILQMQLQLILNYKVKTALISSNYRMAISQAAQNENAYKTIMQQLLAKQADFVDLEKEKEQLEKVKRDFDAFGLIMEECMGEGGPEIFKVRHLSKEYVDTYKRFSMSIDAYLGEILTQLTYKLWKIKNTADVAYPKEINLLIKAFNSQYERRVIDRIMIVNEIDRKLMMDEVYHSRSTALSPLTPLKPNKSKQTLKKVPTGGSKLPVPRPKGFKKSSSSIKPRNNQNLKTDSSAYISTETENEKSGGMIRYVINKLSAKPNKNQERSSVSSKRSKNSNKPPMLDANLDRHFHQKLSSSQNLFKNEKKLQRFLIVNALLKKFYMMFQKRIEYKILFSYIKSIMSMLNTNLDRFNRARIRRWEEPTVREFRQIHTDFTNIQKKEQEKGKSAKSSHQNEESRIQEDDHKENQHIDDFRKKIDTVIKTRSEPVPIPKPGSRKAFPRPNSEERLNRKEKLDPFKQRVSTSAVRECRNYIEEQNRFIIKTKKQIQKSFQTLKGMNSSVTMTSTSTKHKKGPQKDLNKLIAEQVFKISD